MTDKLPTVRGTLTPNRPMADLSWLRVGGAADWLFQPADADDLADFLRDLDPGIPVMPIGVCSNMIIRDGGIRGVVVRMGRGFNDIKTNSDGTVVAGAAALDAHVARKAAQAGVDLVFLRTIPGAIGGAVKMNAGCYGVYMADVFVSASGITREGKAITLNADQLGFSYRSSTVPAGVIITSVTMKAPTGEPDVLEAKMQNALDAREKSQPTKERSCGSTFRNPAGFSSTGKADDVHDLKAWKVIDDAGLRGARVGGAQMSEMHSNFMINTGDATAADLEQLGEEVRKKVYENAQIQLEWEIMRVGEFAKE